MRGIAGFDDAKPSRELASVVRFAGLVLNFDACVLARESGEAIPLTRGEFARYSGCSSRGRDGLSAATLCWTPSPTVVSSRSTAASTC